MLDKMFGKIGGIMKKVILFGMLVFLFSGVFAQTPHVEFGLKGGVNVASFNKANMDNRVGINVGALAHVHLSRHFALQPEVVYSQQGAKLSDNEIQKVNYVNVPVMAQYMFAKGLRLQTGPQVGLLTNSAVKNGDNVTHNNDAYNSADVSWSFGAGYVSPVGLGIDARYNLGLTDITKGNNDVKNRVWQIGLFYQFK